jgi:uncharacterized membrane protein YidH (DUF202 family)
MPVVPLGLSFTLGLALVLVGLALTPLRLLPRPAQAMAYDRREPLLYAAAVLYVATGASIAIVLLS